LFQRREVEKVAFEVRGSKREDPSREMLDIRKNS
jgi:hypothetical protein